MVANNNGRARQDVGLFFLSVTGAFSLWSATNTSYTGHIAFGLKDPASARKAMGMGLLFIGIQAAALILLYGRRASAAALGAVATGATLYAIYDRALEKSEPASAGNIEASGCTCEETSGILPSRPPAYLPAQLMPFYAVR